MSLPGGGEKLSVGATASAPGHSTGQKTGGWLLDGLVVTLHDNAPWTGAAASVQPTWIWPLPPPGTKGTIGALTIVNPVVTLQPSNVEPLPEPPDAVIETVPWAGLPTAVPPVGVNAKPTPDDGLKLNVGATSESVTTWVLVPTLASNAPWPP